MKSHYTLCITGGEREIELENLLASLSAFKSALDTINQVFEDNCATGRRVSVKITAFEKGSFEIGMLLQAIEPTQLILTFVPVLPLIPKIIETFTNVIKIHEFLAGSKPQKTENSGDTVNIYNNCTVLNVPKLDYECYTTPQLSDAVSDIVQPISELPYAEGIRFAEEGNTLIEIPRKSFEKYVASASVEKQYRDVTIPNAVLTIKSVIFEPKYAWKVLYEGESMNVYLADKDFQKRIDGGENFRKGDTLRCDLKITQEYNNTIQQFENKKRVILRVNEHIQASQQ